MAFFELYPHAGYYIIYFTCLLQKRKLATLPTKTPRVDLMTEMVVIMFLCVWHAEMFLTVLNNVFNIISLLLQ